MGYFFALIAISAGMVFIVGGFRKSPWVIPTKRNMFWHPLTSTWLFVPERWLWAAAIVAGVTWIAIGVFVVYIVLSGPVHP